MIRSLSCREFIEFLWAYLAGEIPLDERRDFEHHLALCPSCVAYMNSYRRTMDLGKMAFFEKEEPVPDDVPNDLVDAILSTRFRPPGASQG